VPRDNYLDDDDDKKTPIARDLKFSEFDCPGCNANNPVDPPFGHKAQLMCNYCGMEWEARVRDDGKVDFKEM